MTLSPPKHTEGTHALKDARFFGHPLPLMNLFGVEMWERFSFYGMQGILLIYLYYQVDQGGLGISQTVASGIVGAYGGCVYLSTILAGWLADRLLGNERVLFYSAILVAMGHVCLGLLPGVLGVAVGLVCISLGSGGVKANATAVIGTLYRQDDTRMDAGFSIFYMGVNLGAFIGPLLTGFLQVSWGFHAGFGAAAVGMAIGLIQYAINRKSLPQSASAPKNPIHTSQRLRYLAYLLAALAITALMVLTEVINVKNLSMVVICVTVAIAVVYFVMVLASSKITGAERRRMFGFIPMFIASVAFWSLYQQQFTVLTIYTDERLDRHIFGWVMPVSWVQSINPIFIIVLAPLFAAMWTRLGRRQPSTVIKFSLGVLIMGIAFLMFLLMPDGRNTAPMLGIVAILLVFSLAELCLSPVGMSFSTRVAPAAFHTQVVALFYLSVALGTAISGDLARYYNPHNEGPYFTILGVIAVIVGLCLAISVRPLGRLLQNAR